MRSALLEQNSGKFWQEKPTIISDEFATTGTALEVLSAGTGILKKVRIPAGAYVTKVALLCTARIATQSMDVGDGDNFQRFLQNIVSASEGDLMVAPHTAGSTVAGSQVAGKYYADSDTIDVTTDVTGETNDEKGSAQLLVWYFV